MADEMTNQEQMEQTQPAETALEINHSGPWWRLTAALIDMMLLFIVSGILMGIENLLAIPELSALGILFIFLRILINLLYYSIFESSNFQGTVGKMFLGIKVTNEAGDPIPFLRAFGRTLIKVLFFFILPLWLMMVGFFTIGYNNVVPVVILIAVFATGMLMIAYSQRNQCLHDFVAHHCGQEMTVVDWKVRIFGKLPHFGGFKDKRR